MKKKCPVCNRTFSGEDLSQWFWKQKTTKDGYAWACKECKRTGSRTSDAKYRQKLREKRNYELNKEKFKAREKARAFYQDWHGIYDCAVLGCVKKANELHHVNYKEPLSVIPLCKRHHRDNHDLSRSGIKPGPR